MTPKTYADVRRLECPDGCGRGIERIATRSNGVIRWEHRDSDGHWTPCTAPSGMDALIERLLAEAAAKDAALTKDREAFESIWRDTVPAGYDGVHESVSTLAYERSGDLKAIQSNALARGEELLDAEYELGNLLAAMHGDGGHYQSEHGTEKAAKDAEEKYYRMLEAVEELARLKGERAPKLRFNSTPAPKKGEPGWLADEVL